MIESQVLLLQIQLLRNSICSASPPKKCQRIGWKFCTLATFRRNWAEIEFAAGAAPSQKNLKTRWKGQEDGNEWKGSIEQQDRSEIPRLFILKNSKIFKKIWIWRLFFYDSNPKLLPTVKRRNGFFLFCWGCSLSTSFFLIRTIRPIPAGIFWLNQRKKFCLPLVTMTNIGTVHQLCGCWCEERLSNFPLLPAVIYLQIGLVDMSRSRYLTLSRGSSVEVAVSKYRLGPLMEPYLTLSKG